MAISPCNMSLARLVEEVLMEIEDTLKHILSLSLEEREQFFSQEKNNLVQSLFELIKVLQRTDKSLWPVAIQTITAIGYPYDKPAVTVLVEHLCDANWPGWKEAVQSLTNIDPSVVTPIFIEIFLDEGKKEYIGKTM